MDGSQFDNLVRSLTGSRRSLLPGVLALAAGWQRISEVEARKKRKKKKKPAFNAFGCLDVGKACGGNSGKCCSGICQGKNPKKGKKDKSKCVAHNAGICAADDDLCSQGIATICNATNPNCTCLLTTGNAGFCGDVTAGGDKLCRVCTRDTDCQAEFGPGAACLVFGGICNFICPATGGTACVPPCA